MKRLILISTAVVCIAAFGVSFFVVGKLIMYNNFGVVLTAFAVFLLGMLIGIPRYICIEKCGVSPRRFTLTTLIPVLAAAVILMLYCLIGAGNESGMFAGFAAAGWYLAMIGGLFVGGIVICLLAAGQYLAVGIIKLQNNKTYTAIFEGITALAMTGIIIFIAVSSDTSYRRIENIFNENQQAFTATAAALAEKYEQDDDVRNLFIHKDDIADFDESTQKQMTVLFDSCTDFICIDNTNYNMSISFHFYDVSSDVWGVEYCKYETNRHEYRFAENWYAF